MGVRLDADDDAVRGAATSVGGAQAAYAALTDVEPLEGFLADGAAPKWAHDAKALERVALRSGGAIAGVAFDTLLAGYLLDPAPATIRCSPSPSPTWAPTSSGRSRRQRRGTAVRRRALAHGRGGGRRGGAVGAGHGGADRQAGAARPARRRRAARSPRCWPVWRPAGSASTSTYLEDMGESVRDRMATLKADVYTQAGEEFNLNSPPQLRADPVRPARPAAREEDPQGRAVDRRERAGEAPRRAPGRRRAAAVARAGQAELDLPGGAAEARRPARRPRAHDVQPGRGGDGPALLDQPEPAERADPHRARTADPAGVRAGRARGRCCSCSTTPRSSSASWRTCRGTRGCARRSRAARTSTRRPRRACSACRSTRSTRALGRGPRW